MINFVITCLFIIFTQEINHHMGNSAIKCYLSQRSQRVTIGGVYLEKFTVDYGATSGIMAWSAFLFFF